MAAKSAGKRLRDSILAGLPKGWELDERETELLILAADQADAVAKLEAIVKREGYVTEGSTGQRTVHPAVTEARHGRLAIDRLLGKIVLPDVEAEAGADASTIKGRRNAQQRWAKEKRKEVRRGAA